MSDRATLEQNRVAADRAAPVAGAAASKILIFASDSGDAEVIEETLRHRGVDFSVQRVDGQDAFTQTPRAWQHAEEALRRSEERYRSLIAAVAEIIWITDGEGNVIEDLPAWRAFTGHSCSEIGADGWRAAIHPDDRDRVAAAWSGAVSARTLLEAECRLRRYDGAFKVFNDTYGHAAGDEVLKDGVASANGRLCRPAAA